MAAPEGTASEGRPHRLRIDAVVNCQIRIADGIRMVKGKGVEDEFGQCVNNGKINREQIVKKHKKVWLF